MVSAASSGTTHWYCTKPRGRTAGSSRRRRRAGGRTSTIDWISPARCTRGLAEPGLVEGAHASARRPARRAGAAAPRARGRRGPQRVPRRPPGELVPGRVLALGEHRPAQRTPAGQGVDPGHRVGEPVVAGPHRRHHARRGRGARGRRHRHQRRLDRERAERRARDHAGEPHAADGAPRTARGRGRARPSWVSPSAVTRSRRDDVAAEAAGDVVALAVHVAGDRAADGDVAGARRDREEEPRGSSSAIRSCRLVAGRRAPSTGRRRVDLAGPGSGSQHRSPGVLRRVAVGPAEPARDQAARPGRAHRVRDARRPSCGPRSARGRARCGPSR